MNETMPVYFKDFKSEIKDEFKNIKGQLDIIEEKQGVHSRSIGEIVKKLDIVIEKQDVHFETIGELKVQVTGIELSLKKKASHDYVEEVERRTEKLEKTVFA